VLEWAKKKGEADGKIIHDMRRDDGLKVLFRVLVMWADQMRKLKEEK